MVKELVRRSSNPCRGNPAQVQFECVHRLHGHDLYRSRKTSGGGPSGKGSGLTNRPDYLQEHKLLHHQRGTINCVEKDYTVSFGSEEIMQERQAFD